MSDMTANRLLKKQYNERDFRAFEVGALDPAGAKRSRIWQESLNMRNDIQRELCSNITG